MMIVVMPVVYNALSVLDMTVYDCVPCLAGPKVSGTASSIRLMTILSSYQMMTPYIATIVLYKFVCLVTY